MNSQVIRPEEKAVLARLVGIMVSLELRFVQEKAEDGQLVYRLDPCVSLTPLPSPLPPTPHTAQPLTKRALRCVGRFSGAAVLRTS